MIYTLNQDNKTIGIMHKNKSFIIGSKNIMTIRKIHYSIHPEPKIVLVKSNLYIPKCKGSILDPMNDAKMHLSMMNLNTFCSLPFKGIGIIMPYNLEYEDEDTFIFKSHVVAPIDNNLNDID
jgi:hypothetical protein